MTVLTLMHTKYIHIIMIIEKIYELIFKYALLAILNSFN